ncbi:MAG TPA: hypothetical protein VFD52_07145 [Clostridia bacterium]|nr:hypothetical protein [Clostridia bacterium]
MRKVKRLLAAFLAILFAMGALTISSFAEGTPAGNEFMQVRVETQQSVDYGDVITVKLNITNNYYATTMRWPIVFSASFFEFVAEDFDGSFYDVTAAGQLTATGSSIKAVDATSSLGYDGVINKALLVQWVGNVDSGVVNCYNNPQGSDCISFRLKVKENASVTYGTISIPGSKTDIFYYQAMEDPTDSNSVYTMNKTSCTMTFTDAVVSIDSIVPDVGAKVGTTTVIERFDEGTAATVGHDGYIYGMSDYIFFMSFTEEELLSYIEPVGGATLQLTPNAQNKFSTGAKVEVIFEAEVIATYFIVIFGDINGDGSVDGTDVTLLDYAFNGITLPGYDWGFFVIENATYYACDLSGDYACDGGDYSLVSSAIAGIFVVSQQHTGNVITM